MKRVKPACTAVHGINFGPNRLFIQWKSLERLLGWACLPDPCLAPSYKTFSMLNSTAHEISTAHEN